MKKIWLWLFVAVQCLYLIPAYAQETFTLDGTVIQGTADGASLPNTLPLTLRIISPGGELLYTGNSSADSTGQFSFADVPRYEDESRYILSTQWAGIEQTSLPLTYGEMVLPFEFRVYELTDSLLNLVANRGNLRIEFSDVDTVGLQILMELNYANLGDRIISGDNFRVELPVGSYGIAAEESVEGIIRFIVQDETDGLPIPAVVETQPLVPETPNIMRVSFLVPYNQGAVIDIRLPVALSGMALFVREDTVEVESDLLTRTDQTQTTSGKIYRLYEQNRDLQPNEPFKFTLQGQPTRTLRNPPPPAEEEGSSLVLILILGIGITLVLAVLIAGLLRARQQGGTRP